MFFKQFYDTDLAQGSYMIGCQAAGVAAVVDPRRDIEVYLAEAAAQGMRITVVTETHIHADYLSGSRELAAATGAKLYLSDEGGPDWLYPFSHEPLHNGSRFDLGNIGFEAVHTPGHTPEHLMFLITDCPRGSQPVLALTGDFVFVGDLGRPDLLDEAAGYENTRFEGAKRLFNSLKTRFVILPDHVQVWPGHGAGSACGKALGAVASSTVGYEKLTAWWAGYVANDDEQGFVNELLSGQPDAPVYFGRMKRHNRQGPELLGEKKPLQHMTAAQLSGRINRDVVFVDTRPTVEQWAASVPGALAIPGGNSFATYASWVIDPEVEQRPIVVLAASEQHAEGLRSRLSYVGIDNVVGYVTSLEGFDLTSLALVEPKDLGGLQNAQVLDVRTATEHAAGHVTGSVQLHSGRVLSNLHTLPRGGMLVLSCQTGARSLVVASALRNRGFGNIVELRGSYVAWLEHQRELTPAH